jgi:SAM-dependent methyltransferase
MNLTDDPECPPTVATDAEQPWPFESGAFDVVVVGEILEHLVLDANAVKEARRVLTKGGVLLATVPFAHDEPEYHVRIHSRRSIRRLLENSGFRVERLVERPGLPLKRPVGVLINAVNLALHAIGQKTYYRDAAQAMGNIELALGQRDSRLRTTMGALGLIHHGCTILARPSEEVARYKSVNVREFGGR